MCSLCRGLSADSDGKIINQTSHFVKVTVMLSVSLYLYVIKGENKMTREEIEQDLADALNYSVGYRHGTVHGSVAKVVKKLKTEMKYDTFHVGTISYGMLRDALLRIGEIIQDHEDKYEIIARVGAGFANMNPAVMVIAIQGEYLSVAAYAKEGLIKQHTAEKAIQNLKDSLSGKLLNL